MSASTSAATSAVPSPSPWPAVAIVNPAPPNDPTPPAPPAAPTTPAVSGCVHIVGDSVVLGARPQLQRAIAGAVVDAEVGLQGHQAHQRLRQLMAERRLCPNVVLHIGTNGYLQEPRHLEMVAALAARGRVVLVNIRADRRWTAPNNDLIARAAREVPGVRLVDWSSASERQPAYFVQDGIHLTVAGMGAFAEKIRTALAGPAPASEPAPQMAAVSPQAGLPHPVAASPTSPADPPAPSTSTAPSLQALTRPEATSADPVTITPCTRSAGAGASCVSEVASR